MSAHPAERVLAIVEALGERRFTSKEMPLSIGGAGCAVVLAGVAAGPSAYLAWHDGELFVQPSGSSPVAHNGSVLSASAWLRSGDVVVIGAARIRVSERAGLVVLEVDDGSTGNVTAPPILEPSPIASQEFASAERIEAVRFRAATVQDVTQRNVPWTRWIAGIAALLLLAVAWFIFTAQSVSITTDPSQARVRLDGTLPTLKWGKRYLARPGNYTVRVDQPGFRPELQPLQVTDKPNQQLSITLQKLPGKVRVDVPAVASISIDDGQPTNIPAELELSAGAHRVSITTERYLDYTGSLEVKGGGERQVFKPDLVPRWAVVTLTSEPAGAEVLVDGQSRGTTPASIEVLAGRYPLELRHTGFKPWTTDIQVKAHEPLDLGVIKLGVPDGELTVKSEPAGASVTLGGVYRGVTPITLSVRSDVTQSLALAKPGYEAATREVAVKSAERRSVEVALAGVYGELSVRVQPADAQLFVDGQARGAAQQTLKLLATSHDIEVRKNGYATYKTTVTPRPGIAQVVETALVTQEQVHLMTYANVITSKGGETLKLMPRGAFVMGSPRREPGRRANEVQRAVDLKRPFYMGVYEVTNAQFQKFDKEHHSGFAGNSTLELETQPVVGVTWEKAVAYCNWLSQQDGLPPAYEQKDGKWVAVTPLNTGYRLPTDAEWEFVARYTGSGQQRRYPWGDALPVAARSGNYADTSARVLVEDVVPDYDDGYAVTAPVGKFPPNALGLFDIGGNVAEWAHDYYSVGVEANKAAVDPLGPADGSQHVIRGSSWRQASATDLRLSARDFGERSRNDLGFRIARYAE